MTFVKQYSEDYFRQLTTERKVKEKKDNGTTLIQWEQHGRDEVFNFCVYCLCGAEFLINIWCRVTALAIPGRCLGI